MKKLVLLVTLLLFGSLLFSFTTSEKITYDLNENVIGFLPSNCDEPIHFQIDSQEPCPIVKVNPDTGALSLKRKVSGLCGNMDSNERKRVEINYSVTNADGVTHSAFIILADLEEE